MQAYYLGSLVGCAFAACHAGAEPAAKAQTRDPSPRPLEHHLPVSPQAHADQAEVNDASPAQTGSPTSSTPGESTDERLKAREFVRQALFFNAEISSHRRAVLFSIAPGVSQSKLIDNLRCVLEGEYSRASDFLALVLSALTERSSFALYTSDTSDQKKAKIRELLDDLGRSP